MIRGIHQAAPGILQILDKVFDLGIHLIPGTLQSPGRLDSHQILGILQGSEGAVYWGRKAGKSSLYSPLDILQSPDTHQNFGPPDIHQSPGTLQNSGRLDSHRILGILQDSAGAVCSGRKAGKSSLYSPPGIHQSPGIRQSSDRPDSSRPDILVPGSRKSEMDRSVPCWRGNRRPCRRCREVWTDCSDSFHDIRSVRRRAAGALARQEALFWLPEPAAEHLSVMTGQCLEKHR